MQKYTFLQRPKSYVVCSFLVITLYDIVRLLYVLICIIKCFFLLKGINIATLYKGSFLDFYFFYIKRSKQWEYHCQTVIKFQLICPVRWICFYKHSIFLSWELYYTMQKECIFMPFHVNLKTKTTKKTKQTNKQTPCFKLSLLRKLTKCSFLKVWCMMTTFSPLPVPTSFGKKIIVAWQ